MTADADIVTVTCKCLACKTEWPVVAMVKDPAPVECPKGCRGQVLIMDIEPDEVPAERNFPP